MSMPPSHPVKVVPHPALADRHAGGHHRGVLWIYVNGRCNMSCVYCLDGRNALPGLVDNRPDFCARLVQLQSELGFTPVFTGGEPLIVPIRLLRCSARSRARPRKPFKRTARCRARWRASPRCRSLSWVSISYIQQTLDTPALARAASESVALLHDRGIRWSGACSPENVGEHGAHRGEVRRARLQGGAAPIDGVSARTVRVGAGCRRRPPTRRRGRPTPSTSRPGRPRSPSLRPSSISTAAWRWFVARK